jgi:O-acetyl-ADP-ribose deacetylase (regulator of RNase III)
MLTITVINNKNIFDTKCQTIVNTVNCVGVMGKGIALEMKNRYPEMFDKYKSFCDKKLIEIGKLWLYKNDDNKWILNFPTKIHWKNNSEYEYIEKGMQKFVETYKEKNITSIAFPMLGCSNGGLDNDTVLNIMVKHLMKCDNLIIEIYK